MNSSKQADLSLESLFGMRVKATRLTELLKNEHFVRRRATKALTVLPAEGVTPQYKQRLSEAFAIRDLTRQELVRCGYSNDEIAAADLVSAGVLNFP